MCGYVPIRSLSEVAPTTGWLCKENPCESKWEYKSQRSTWWFCARLLKSRRSGRPAVRSCCSRPPAARHCSTRSTWPALHQNPSQDRTLPFARGRSCLKLRTPAPWRRFASLLILLSGCGSQMAWCLFLGCFSWRRWSTPSASGTRTARRVK